MEENKQRPDPEVDTGYVRERQRAQERVIEQSMNRKLGRLSRLDVSDLPPRADNSNYNPRRW